MKKKVEDTLSSINRWLVYKLKRIEHETINGKTVQRIVIGRDIHEDIIIEGTEEKLKEKSISILIEYAINTYTKFKRISLGVNRLVLHIMEDGKQNIEVEGRFAIEDIMKVHKEYWSDNYTIEKVYGIGDGAKIFKIILKNV